MPFSCGGDWTLALLVIYYGCLTLVYFERGEGGEEGKKRCEALRSVVKH